MPLLSTFGAASARGFGNLSGIILPVDDLWNTVSFLSHFDGANNGVNNAFDDGSTSNHTITANGNVTQGSFGPFARPDGEWSNYFDGTGDYLSTPSQGTLAASANWCVEAYFYCTGTTSGTYRVMSSNESTDSDAYFLMRIRLGQYNFYTDNVDSSLVGTVAFNAWTHIAMTKSGTTVRAFVNGVKLWEATDNGTTVIQNLIIGWGYGSEYFPGFISNARFVNGSSVYTSNFTPPTAPLTAITNTTLLTCQSNRFVDNSASAHTITPYADASVSAFGPFLTSEVYDPAVNGASAYFDGSGDSLTAPDSADWDFGSGNYTVEFWIYPRTTGTIKGLVNHWGDFSVNNVAWTFEWHSDGNINYYIKTNNGVSTLVATNGASIANQWMHVAAVRNSNVHTLYLDGVSKATVTDAGTMNNCTDILRVGDYFDGNYGFDGEICDVRVVKGTAVYTGNFTPPTAPLTAITNTKLLLNMQDAQAIDSAAQNNMTLLGNTKLSTTQAKFGDTSMYFDGSGDYAVVQNFTQLTGELTIEFWVNPSALSPKNGMFQQGFADGGLAIRAETSGSLSVMRSGVSSYFSTSTTISANVWTHIALVYYNGVLKCYINGTADSQTSTTSANWTTSGNEFILGTRWNGGAISNPMTGYLDDFRISNMARYTSNFTAPSAPFADKGQ